MPRTPPLNTAAHITPQQIVAVSKLLDTHTITEGCRPGTCRFTAGHNDAWIAKQVGITVNQAGNVRQKLKGQLDVAKNNGRERSQGRISALALLIADLATRLGEIDIAQQLRALAGEGPGDRLPPTA